MKFSTEEQTVVFQMHNDWKDFWFDNKWASSGFLRKKFGIEKYDYDNFFRSRTKTGLNELRNQFSYKRNDIKPQELYNIFSEVWTYYWTQENKDSLPSDAEEFTQFCLRFRQSTIRSSSFSFLLDTKYVRKLPDFSEWEANGYTYLSYFFMNFEPTASRLREAKIIPAMFQNTTLSHFSRDQAAEFLSYLYLYHFRGLSLDVDEKKMISAKQMFCFRQNETGFFSTKEAQNLGFSTTIPFNLSDIKTRLRFIYASEIGLENGDQFSWSKKKYLDINPDFEGAHCLFCDAPNPDFHHLLQRAIYPELTYHAENLVPLCSTSHNAITRNQDPKLASSYRQCIELWKSAPEGSKATVFFELLKRFHDLATGKS